MLRSARTNNVHLCRSYHHCSYLGSVRQLRQFLCEAWHPIGRGFLDDLVDAMPHRVEVVIIAQGRYTA